ncbi:MAG: alpha/beta fold hydrolase [Desulfofustis sp.]|nr:alpha/beta fold hydrolase [Desulfofustis sp.]
MINHDSISALAQQVLDQAPPRFALAGLSMGGIVAMELCNQAPDRIVRLALMDTNPLAEKEEIRSRRDMQIAKVKGGGLRQVMEEEMKPLYLIGGSRRQQILEICMEMALGLGADVFTRQSIALQGRADQRDTLRTVRVPTLILFGEDDQLCPPERHELMHELIPGSKLVAIRKAGHLPTLEQPKQVTEALLGWLHW